MFIELKNVKHAAFASHETNCFEATVYIDGKRAGTVSNEGYGGCNSYHPQELEDRLNAYAKTLPPLEGYGITLEQNAYIVIDDIFVKHLVAADYRRAIKRAVLFKKADGHLYTIKPKSGTVAELLAKRDKVPALAAAVAILNLMPEPEALKLYSAA